MEWKWVVQVHFSNWSILINWEVRYWYYVIATLLYSKQSLVILQSQTTSSCVPCIKEGVFFWRWRPKESIILTTFYGLYLSHKYTNITNYISSYKGHGPRASSNHYSLVNPEFRQKKLTNKSKILPHSTVGSSVLF